MISGGWGVDGLDDVGNTLGFDPSRTALARALKGVRWRRAFWLLLASAGLVLVAAAAFNSSPVSQARLRLLMAALKDPMALFTERSPGFRTGNLIPIKGKGGPRERVLSSARERPPAKSEAPHERVLGSARDRSTGEDVPAVVLDMPVVIDIPPGALFNPGSPAQATITPNLVIGSPFIPVTPFNYSVPGFTPEETPPPLVATTPPQIPIIPGSTLSQSLPPIIIASNPPTTTPGGTTSNPPGTETPPGSTPGTSGGPGPVIVPEPSTGSMMVLGLIATGFALRRNRKPR